MNALDGLLKRKPVSRVMVVVGLVFILLGVISSSAILNSSGLGGDPGLRRTRRFFRGVDGTLTGVPAQVFTVEVLVDLTRFQNPLDVVTGLGVRDVILDIEVFPGPPAVDRTLS